MAVCGLLVAAAPSSAQSARASGSGMGGGGERPAVMEIPRLASPIVFDGDPDDAAWQAVPMLPFTQFWPVAGASPSLRSEVRLAYDEEYIYASGRFFDEPGRISANTLARDRWDGDDTFELLIDSFNDNETALKFVVTPLGALRDVEITNDGNPIGGEWSGNVDWNTLWDARSILGDEVWTAEIRVPFSSLGFEVVDGTVVMGVNVSRYIARLDEVGVFPSMPGAQAGAHEKASLAQDMRFTGIQSSRQVVVTPYLLSGASRIRDLSAENPSQGATEVSKEVGFDLRYGLTTNLTLDITANTDFAQVEADAQQVNLDRFSLFFPEKRQFFQERAGVFQFVYGSEGRLFHSRRIGLDNQGRARRILGGARLVGRIGKWDLGLLSMEVDGSLSVSRENDAVFRAKRTLFNDRSSVGGMVTRRADREGGTDLAFGLDGEFNVSGEDFLLANVSQTRNQDDVGSFVDRSLFRLQYERRTTEGFAWEAYALFSGGSYDPVLGFQERSDFSTVKTRLFHTWNPRGGRAARVRGILMGQLYRRNEDGSLDSGFARVRTQINFTGGHFFNLALNYVYNDVRDPVALPGGDIVPGRFHGLDIFTNASLNQALPVSGSVLLYTGAFMDGWRLVSEFGPTWSVSKHLSASLNYRLQRIWFPDRNQRVDADVAFLRLSTALNVKLFGEAFLQYNMATDKTSANFRLRYRFEEGRDLFIVLDESRDLGSLPAFDLDILGRTDRRFLVKYSHAIRR